LKTIFIVDDSDVNLVTALRALDGLYNILTMPSAERMFTIFEKITPDLIILDIDMPEMDGFDAIKKLKEDDKTANIPVVFLTSYEDASIEAKGFELGAVDFITKPFSTTVMQNRIARHLQIEELLKIRTERLQNLQESIQELETENRSINRQLALQGEHYNVLQTHITETKRAEHDLRHHLSVIQSYNNAGESKKLEEYLSNYIGSLPGKADITFCENFAVSAILQYYINIAGKEGIQVDVNTIVPGETGVSDSDLCIIFGNCVENAIEACRKLEGEKFIKIRSNHTGKLLTINISNSFDGKLNKEGDSFMSRKHTGEGIGISSVRAVVDKYGDSARFETDGNVFRVVIILRIG